MDSRDISALVMDIYDRAIFVPVFSNIKIDEVRCGGAKASLKIEASRHLSKQGFVQSGVLTALTDVASKVAGASVGVMADTLSFGINLTKCISACNVLEASSVIKHHGRRTMVIASEIRDENNFLLATALTTMSVDGFFDEIPGKW
ncbi:MAG: PaaI family thioesterase [Acidaminococcaceae bacterium]